MQPGFRCRRSVLGFPAHCFVSVFRGETVVRHLVSEPVSVLERIELSCGVHISMAMEALFVPREYIFASFDMPAVVRRKSVRRGDAAVKKQLSFSSAWASCAHQTGGRAICSALDVQRALTTFSPRPLPGGVCFCPSRVRCPLWGCGSRRVGPVVPLSRDGPKGELLQDDNVEAGLRASTRTGVPLGRGRKAGGGSGRSSRVPVPLGQVHRWEAAGV